LAGSDVRFDGLQDGVTGAGSWNKKGCGFLHPGFMPRKPRDWRDIVRFFPSARHCQLGRLRRVDLIACEWMIKTALRHNKRGLPRSALLLPTQWGAWLLLACLQRLAGGLDGCLGYLPAFEPCLRVKAGWGLVHVFSP